MALWYCRHRMWVEASKLDSKERQSEKGEVLDGIDRLNEYEFNLCLKRVHKAIQHRPALSKHLEKGKGVANFAEYLQSPDRADYNGTGGGEVFKWYTRPVFEMFLLARCTWE